MSLLHVSENLTKLLAGQAKAGNNITDKVCRTIIYEMIQLQKVKGFKRAALFHKKLDDAIATDLKNNPHIPICKNECSYCCYMDVDVFPSEILAINRMIEKRSIRLNYTKENPSPCPFLKDKKCQIYNIRPAVCRKYYVVGDLKNCIIRTDKVIEVKIIAMPLSEIIFSAMLNIGGEEMKKIKEGGWHEP